MRNKKTSEHTSHAILTAARRLFAKSGFSGTSTASIAKAAEVNEALIFRYFGNKAKLWQAVKSHVLEGISITPLNSKPASFEDFVDEAITQRLALYASHPDVSRLTEWQRLEAGKTQLTGGSAYSPDQWEIPLKYLQSMGKINPKVDMRLLIVWLASSVNALIADEAGIFKVPDKHASYIDMIKQGMIIALSDRV